MKADDLAVFEEKALAELARVTSRETTLHIVGSEWDDNGVFEFVTGNGWTFAVFNDVGEWDYLEWVEDPSGLMWDFGDGWSNKSEAESLALQNWSPPDAELWYRAPVKP